jgi:hypothetical protein
MIINQVDDFNLALAALVDAAHYNGAGGVENSGPLGYQEEELPDSAATC